MQSIDFLEKSLQRIKYNFKGGSFMTYIITIESDSHWGKQFVSSSRNAKQHLREHGGHTCTVRDSSGKIISQCKYSCEGGGKYYYTNANR